jgi:hypothetical protein
MVERFPIAISFESNPIKEKTRKLALSGTVSVYLPEASVLVPIMVPFTTTLTPGIGRASSSVTNPDSVLSSGAVKSKELAYRVIVAINWAMSISPVANRIFPIIERFRL